MKLELKSLAKELERAKANSKDIIVDTQNIQMEPSHYSRSEERKQKLLYYFGELPINKLMGI